MSTKKALVMFTRAFFLAAPLVGGCSGRAPLAQSDRAVQGGRVILLAHGLNEDKHEPLWSLILDAEALLRNGPLSGPDQLLIHVYQNQADVGSVAGPQPAWVRAIALPEAIHLWSPWAWPESIDRGQIVGIIAHEWVHVRLMGLIEGRDGGVVGIWPPEMEEGIASLLSGQGAYRADREQLGAHLRAHREIDPFDPSGSVELYYTACHHWVDSLRHQQSGWGWMKALARQARAGVPVGEAFQQIFGQTMKVHQGLFLDQLRQSK
ncbi:MAG: hypothetical protein ACE366_28045 [Bradymonadia bacterium]